MEFKIIVYKDEDGEYIAENTTLNLIGDGKTEIEALKDLMKVTIDVLDLAEKEGLTLNKNITKKVKCEDTNAFGEYIELGIGEYVYALEMATEFDFTYGKKYKILGVKNNRYIVLKNDKGIKAAYLPDYFLPDYFSKKI